MVQRGTRQLPRMLHLAAIVTLVAGYVPLTSLDHLHLHLHHGLHFTHDHAHIGQHDHQPVAPSGNQNPDDSDDDSGAISAVLSLGDAAQMRPAPIAVTAQASPVATAAGRAHDIRTDEPVHPSWSSRAPPG